MTDDWRIRVLLREDGFAHALTERLEAAELEHELETRFADRVIVSRDGPEVFCYVGDWGAARAVAELMVTLATREHWSLDDNPEIQRWHPVAQKWCDPGEALPDDPASIEAERAERIERERLESAAQGFPAFEVRVACATRTDADRLSERLREEGLQVVQRWRYVLIGAPDEDSAASLAEGVRADLPAGATVGVGASVNELLAEQPRNPFAVLGGLGA